MHGFEWPIFVYRKGVLVIELILERGVPETDRFNFSKSSSTWLFLSSCVVYRNLFHSSCRGCAKFYKNTHANAIVSDPDLDPSPLIDIN